MCEWWYLGSVRYQGWPNGRRKKNSHVHCVNIILSSWNRRRLVIWIENLQKAKNVYTITLIYNTKLGVHMYNVKVMYKRIFYFDFFINDGNLRKYARLLSWSLPTRNPNFRLSHLFFTILYIIYLFLCILSRSDRFQSGFTFQS